MRENWRASLWRVPPLAGSVARITAAFELVVTAWAWLTAPPGYSAQGIDVYLSILLVASVFVMDRWRRGRVVALGLCVVELTFVSFANSQSHYNQGVLSTDLFLSAILTVAVGVAAGLAGILRRLIGDAPVRAVR